MRHYIISAFVSVGLLSPVLALAKTDRPLTRFGSTVDVRVVNVEAVVTDQDGNRVGGLTKEDFELIVDGRPVSINYFTEISDGELAAPKPGAAAALPPVEGLNAGQALPVSYLVFIDEFFPKSHDRNRAIDGLLEDLDLVDSRDSMAVVAYDGTRLHRLVDWTSSRADVEGALVQAKDRKAGGLFRIVESRNIETAIELRQHASRIRNQVENAMTAASSSMRAMGAPAGRKVMILMSGGWPFDPSYLLPLNDHTVASRHGVIGGWELVKELVDTANLLGYTIYGVDLPGLEGNVGQDAANRGFDMSEALEPAKLDSSSSTTMDIEVPVSEFERERQNHALLREVASETGGMALLNAGAVAGLESSVADTRSFYWIGFDATAIGNDQRHSIELEVRRPELELRSRQSYLDLSREQEVTIQAESSLLFADSGDQNALRVTVGDAERHGFRKVRVPIEVKIPLGSMMAVASENGFDVRVEVRIGALDVRGQVSDIPVVPVVFSGETQPQPGSFGTYATTLELRRGQHDLLVTAYDPLLDQTLASRVSVEF